MAHHTPYLPHNHAFSFPSASTNSLLSNFVIKSNCLTNQQLCNVHSLDGSSNLTSNLLNTDGTHLYTSSREMFLPIHVLLPIPNCSICAFIVFIRSFSASISVSDEVVVVEGSHRSGRKTSTSSPNMDGRRWITHALQPTIVPPGM